MSGEQDLLTALCRVTEQLSENIWTVSYLASLEVAAHLDTLYFLRIFKCS